MEAAGVGPARASDRAAVLGFCARLYPGGDYVQDTWDSWMREGCVRVARAGGRPAGVCSVAVRGSEAWVEGLRVDARLQGRGTGSALVAGAADEARSRGARVLRMFAEECNSASLRLAARAGFERAGTWTWYALAGAGARPPGGACGGGEARRAPSGGPAPPRGLSLDSWRAFSGAGRPLFLEGASCALAPSEHFAGTLLVTVMEARDLSGLARHLRSESPRWPARRMSGWTSGIHVASGLDGGPFRGLFEPLARFELLALRL